MSASPPRQRPTKITRHNVTPNTKANTNVDSGRLAPRSQSQLGVHFDVLGFFVRQRTPDTSVIDRRLGDGSENRPNQRQGRHTHTGAGSVNVVLIYCRLLPNYCCQLCGVRKRFNVAENLLMDVYSL